MEATQTQSKKNIASVSKVEFSHFTNFLKVPRNKSSFNVLLNSVLFHNISLKADQIVEGDDSSKWEQLRENITKLQSLKGGFTDIEFMSLWAKKSQKYQKYNQVILYIKLNASFIQCVKQLFPSGNALKVKGTFTWEQCDMKNNQNVSVDAGNSNANYGNNDWTQFAPENVEFNVELNTGEIARFSDHYRNTPGYRFNVKVGVFIEWEGIVPTVEERRSRDFEVARESSDLHSETLQMDPGTILSKMFTCDFTKDLTIVVGKGREVKCHKVVFSAHSTVLAAMLSSAENDMKDSKTGQIEMRELTENGANYLLQYFYGMPIPLNTLSSDMALELFQTASKYNLPEMADAIGKLFVEKESEWFTADMALGLHFFVKKLDGFGDLKELALKILTRNPEEVKNSRRYKQLTQKEALDLLWILFETK